MVSSSGICGMVKLRTTRLPISFCTPGEPTGLVDKQVQHAVFLFTDHAAGVTPLPGKRFI